MDQRRNHKKIVKYFGMTKSENIQFKAHRMQQKSVLRGKVKLTPILKRRNP